MLAITKPLLSKVPNSFNSSYVIVVNRALKLSLLYKRSLKNTITPAVIVSAIYKIGNYYFNLLTWTSTY